MLARLAAGVEERFAARPARPGAAALLLFSLAISAVASSCFADQDADPHAAQPERPTVATHAGTVAPGWLEVETGIEADRFNDGTHSHGVPTELKLGLASHVQLGIGLPALHPSAAALGMGDITAGLKWRIVDGAPVVRDFALLPSIKFPTGSREAGRGTGTTDFSILAISSRSIGPVSLDLNVGYTRRGGDGTNTPRNATLWTVSSGFPVHGSLGMAAEVYGYPGTAGPAGSNGIVAVLAGPTYNVRPWLVIDSGIIEPLTGPQPKAVYAGLVWNVGRVGGR